MKFLVCAESFLRISGICDDIQDILEERCLGEKNDGIIAVEKKVSPTEEAMIYISPNGTEDLEISKIISKILLEQLSLRCHRVNCSVVSEVDYIEI